MAKTTKTTGEQRSRSADAGAITRAILSGALDTGSTAQRILRDDFQQLRKPGTYVAEVATDPQAFELLSLGLYREPASALRELVSNAYDADAQTVKINLNPPNFDQITVQDNGSGMTLEALRQVIRNVGGSLKRRPEGRDAGVIGNKPGVSPKGRPLIGKLGIGLYSVRHMTNHFRITTKEAPSSLRYTAEVRLRERQGGEASTEAYVAGTATIVAEAAPKGEHYTRVELLDVTQEAKNVLRSFDRWDQYEEMDELQRRGILRFHIERLWREGGARSSAALPWGPSDKTPLDRFRALVDRLSEKEEMVQTGPAVDLVLDYYFGMIWKLSHSAPLDYVQRGPFSLTAKDGVDLYSLDGNATPEILPRPPKAGMTIADMTGVREVGTSPTPFRVFIDELELRRPVLFNVDETLYSKRQFIRTPKLFVGSYDSERDRKTGWDAVSIDDDYPNQMPLKFTAYIWWSPKIVPKENIGVMTRIRNSSGTGFDHGFLDYRTSELSRIRQLSAEVFVEEGLDDALNIDRESFNQSHPHYRTLQRWMHRQLTRIMSRLKSDQKRVRDERKEHDTLAVVESVERTARGIWSAHRDDGEDVPSVVITGKSASRRALADDTMLYIGGVRGPGGNVEKDERLNATLRAVALVLDAYGLLEDLSPSARSQLLSDIAAVLRA